MEFLSNFWTLTPMPPEAKMEENCNPLPISNAVYTNFAHIYIARRMYLCQWRMQGLCRLQPNIERFSLLSWLMNQTRMPKMYLDPDRKESSLGFLSLQCASPQNVLVMSWTIEEYLEEATIYHTPWRHSEFHKHLRVVEHIRQRKSFYEKKKGIWNNRYEHN